MACTALVETLSAFCPLRPTLIAHPLGDGMGTLCGRDSREGDRAGIVTVDKRILPVPPTGKGSPLRLLPAVIPNSTCSTIHSRTSLNAHAIRAVFIPLVLES